MESFRICERCNILTSLPHILSCNHSLCSHCITRIIVYNHIRTLTINDQITITCLCKLGTKNFTVADIYQLTTDSNEIFTCKMHKAASKFHCSICELWLCEECIEIHKIFNSYHELSEGHIGFRKCNIHEGHLKDLYCHDCDEIICPVCVSLKGTTHSTHYYQLIKDYSNQLKAEIRPVLDFSAQVKQIEKMREDFRRQVDCILETKMKMMDQLIQLVEQSKQIFREKLHQTLQRADLLLHLLGIYYFDLNNSQSSIDIHLLKGLSEENLEFNKLELRDESEKILSQIYDTIEKYFQMRPVEEIHAKFIQRDWRENTLILSGHDYILSLIQLQDGRIASGSSDKTIKIWEVKETYYKNTLTLTGHKGSVRSLIQLKDGRIASGSYDNTIKVWELSDTEFQRTFTLTGHKDPIYSLIQLKDGRIASSSYDNTIKIWKKKEARFKNSLTLTNHKMAITCLIQLKDGRIASGSEDTTIKIWEVKETEFKNTLTLTGHNNIVCSLIQLKDGRIASASYDHTIKIWEVKETEFKNTLTLTGHTNYVWSLTELKDGRLASGSNDKTIKVWKVKETKFKNTLTLTGHNNSVWSIIQMKDGRIVSGSEDKTIKVWD